MSEEQPWFGDGLKFECSQCGDCCTGDPGWVWVNKAEIAALAETQQLDVATFEQKYVRKVGIRKTLVEFPNGDCVFFDGQLRKCTVYEARPRQCRTWPFWHSNIRDEKSWKETCEACPGCGKGDFVPADQVFAQANEIRL